MKKPALVFALAFAALAGFFFVAWAVHRLSDCITTFCLMKRIYFASLVVIFSVLSMACISLRKAKR